MGLESRDYMREVPIYKQLVGRGGPPPPNLTSTAAAEPPWGPPPRPVRVVTRTQTRPWAWFLLGAIVVISVIAFAVQRSGTTPHAAGPTAPVPVVAPMPALSAPSSTQTYPIEGPSQVATDSVMTATGSMPTNVSGIVVVEARWNDGPWFTLATTNAANGSYTVRYQLSRPGIVHVRIELPNGDSAVQTLTVT